MGLSVDSTLKPITILIKIFEKTSGKLKSLCGSQIEHYWATLGYLDTYVDSESELKIK